MLNEEQKEQETKIKKLEDENEMLKIEVEFLKQLIPSDTKGNPALEMISKCQKELAELNVLKIQYYTIITEAALERQRYQIEVDNLIKELRGCVQRKKRIDERMESKRISEKA